MKNLYMVLLQNILCVYPNGILFVLAPVLCVSEELRMELQPWVLQGKSFT